MKRLILSIALLGVCTVASAQTTRETRIPLEVSPHSGTDHLCLRERKECDSIRRLLVRTKKSAVAAREAVCNHPVGAVSVSELCLLILTVQRAALADTTTY